jgi:hypothetical protein
MTRIDFYTLFHKALRRELFALVDLAGRSDAADPAAAARLREASRRAWRMLAEHARHEDDFLHPLIAERLPALHAAVEAEHARLDADQRALEAMAEALGADPEAGLAYYRALNRFLAATLAHLDHEEATIMPALWEAGADAALAELMGRFAASFSPEARLRDATLMLAAMSPAERAGYLAKLRQALPAEALAELAARLEGQLPAEALEAIAGRPAAPSR